MVLNTEEAAQLKNIMIKDYLIVFYLIGTSSFFDDIGKGLFYTGHQVIEPLGKHKITDLLKTDVKINNWKNGIIVKSSFKIKSEILKVAFFDEINNKLE